MRNTAWYSGVFLAVVLVMAGSIWGPEALAKYKDKGILNQPHMENVEEAGEGYRYRLNANEKLYILSNCISSQETPGSEQNALLHGRTWKPPPAPRAAECQAPSMSESLRCRSHISAHW